MSVDGEVVSDLLRVVEQRSAFDGLGVLVISGPCGSGKSAALRSAVAASALHANAMISRFGKATWGSVASPALRILVCDYDSIAAATAGWFSLESKSPGQIVAVVDDLSVVWWMLEANEHRERGRHFLLTMAQCGAVLLTTVERVADLPSLATKLAGLLLEYPVPRLNSTGVCRMLREVLPPASSACSVPDGTEKRLLEAAAAVHVVCGLPLSQAVVAVTAATRLDDGDTGGTVVRMQPSSAQPRLYGLESLLERLSMLCRIHSSHHSSDYASIAGRVACQAASSTGVLLHGASGCGKSALLSVLAAQNPQLPFFCISASQLYSKYLGESEGRLRRAFSVAREVSPCVLVIEDIDVLAHSRKSQSETSSGGGVDVAKRMLAALLCELDGVSSSRGTLVIGTTNQPHVIDAALLRQGRLESAIFVPPLTTDAVVEMTRDFLGRFSNVEPAVLSELVRATADRCRRCSAASLKVVFRKVVELHAECGAPPSLQLWKEAFDSCSCQLLPMHGQQLNA